MPINLREFAYRTPNACAMYIRESQNMHERLTPIVSAGDTDHQAYICLANVHKAIGLQIYTQSSPSIDAIECCRAVSVRFTRANANKMFENGC